MNYICIDKIRDKYGRIYKYKLKDSSGNIVEVTADTLKRSITNKTVNVLNLKLTSDGRLYSTQQVNTQVQNVFAYVIEIQYAVYNTDGSIAWFVDKNGFRYTYEQLEGIRNGSSVRGLAGIPYRKGMKILLMKGRAGMKALRVIDPKLCIICEDSKSGKVFYESIIKAIYPNLRFDLYTSNGNLGFMQAVKNLEDTDSNRYKTYLIVSDRQEHNGKYINSIKNTIKAITNTYHKNVCSFKPICVEEVILSSPYIKLKKNDFCSELHDKIVSYVRTGEPYYTYDNYGTYGLCGIKVNSLERLLYKALNESSKLMYSKDKIDTCFFTICCPMIVGSTSFCSKCNKYEKDSITGSSMYTNVSLICGLQNVINEIIGYSSRYLLKWSKSQLKELYSIFR